MEIIKGEMKTFGSTKGKNKFNKNKFYFKRITTFISSLLILFGAGIITKMILLQSHYSTLQESGFINNNQYTNLAFLGTLFILNILIYELNTKLRNESIAIGFVLAITFSLTQITNHMQFQMPIQIMIFTTISNLISIPLASYIFSRLWD